jgi:hypothetical protein
MQMIAVLIIGWIVGLYEVNVMPDSTSYIATSHMSLHEALTSSRTLGYPLLLRLVALVSPDYNLMPWVHLAILFAAVFFFDYALRRYGATPWQAFAASSGFLYAAVNWLIGALLTDFLAQIMAVTAVSFLFLVVSNKKSVPAWLGLCLSIACSYHIRPVYLFLVPMIPCLGIALLRIRMRWLGEPFRWKWPVVGLLTVSITPYLGYCLFRLVVVGHFGLVSFGGTVLTGFAVEFLDKDLIETELSEQYRPLAFELLKEREKLGVKNAFLGNWLINMKQWQKNYDTNIHVIAKDISIRMFGDDRVVRNREMSNFSREVIWHNKGKYLLLFLYGWPWALLKLLGRCWSIQVLLFLNIFFWWLQRM